MNRLLRIPGGKSRAPDLIAEFQFMIFEFHLWFTYRCLGRTPPGHGSNGMIDPRVFFSRWPPQVNPPGPARYHLASCMPEPESYVRTYGPAYRPGQSGHFFSRQEKKELPPRAEKHNPEWVAEKTTERRKATQSGLRK